MIHSAGSSKAGMIISGPISSWAAIPARRSAACFLRHFGVVAFRGDQIWIVPDRFAVLSPVEREGPARQTFAGIPFALAIMEETAGREALTQTADQFVGLVTLGWPDGAGVPFLRF